MAVLTKDLGIATAYGYAKSKGYTGTEEQFAELMASYADVGQTAVDAALAATQSASAASGSAEAAAGSANMASTKAGEASTSAQTAQAAAGTATTQAQAASASASAASGSASAAAGSASNAQAAAEEAASVYEDLRNNTIVGLYGAKWDRLTNHLTRLAMAEGITTDTTNFGHFGSINENYENPFDDIYPWSEMFVCDVDLDKYRAGTYSLRECITAVYGDPDFTYEPSQTNFVGRYRPEFWGHSEEDADGNVSYYISQIERDGFTHYDEAIDGISFAVDVGGSHVSSGAGVPLANIAVSTIHARAKADGFTLQDIEAVDAQTLLYLVEYANWNSQQALGNGCDSCYRQNAADVISNVATADGLTSFDVEDSALSTLIYVGTQLSFGATSGATTYKGIVKSFTVSGNVYSITLDRELAITNGMILSVHGFDACEFDLLGSSLGNASGYIGTNSKANVWYRGTVLFANRYQYVLGIYRQTGTNHLWICSDGVNPDDYDALNTAVHTDTGIALPNVETADWQTVGGNAQMIPGVNGFMATGASEGTSTSPVGDRQYVPLISVGNTILLFGGSAYNGWSCGALCGYWRHGAGTSDWTCSGRPLLKSSL